MRDLVDFYRKNPALAALIVAVGLALAIVTATLGDGGGFVLPVAFVLLVGLVAGVVVGFIRRR